MFCGKCSLTVRCVVLPLYEISTVVTARHASTTLNAQMKKLIDSKQFRHALDIFDKQSHAADDFALNMALKACSNLPDYRRGLGIVRQLSPKSLNNPFIQTSLVHFYMKSGDLKSAIGLFNSIPVKTNPLYTTLFKGLISMKKSKEVLNLYEQNKLKLDEGVFVMVSKACSEICDDRARRIGKQLIVNLLEDLKGSGKVMNSTIFMLMKFGNVVEAEQLFRQMKHKTIYTYGAMMKGYNHNQMFEKALDLFYQIDLAPNGNILTIIFNTCTHLFNDRALQTGKELLRKMNKSYYNDDIIITSAIRMLMKFDLVNDAERLFRQVKSKSALTYHAMINGYSQLDELDKCFQLFDQMKSDQILPNEVVCLSMIGVCAKIAIRSVSQSIVDQLPSHMKSSRNIQNALISMWGKSSSIEKSKEIFESLDDPDMVTYSSMINAYGLNGMGVEAVELYRRTPVDMRDEVCRICALNACSHTGLLNECRHIFDQTHHKTEKIVTTMVDCLSRLTMFDEAELIIEDYEKTNPPSSAMYMALLSGARNVRDSNLSNRIYKKMQLLFSDEKDTLIAGSVLLSNIYSSIGDHHRAGDIRTNRIKQFGYNVKVGLSWTSVNNQLVRFKAHDHSHPQSEEIYEELQRLSCELREHGHTFDSSWITRPVNEDETVESVLCGHSEKLAIAFNFIQQPPPSIIQISKNLRICGDCHAATKLITKLRRCEIIIRDTNRIHHFSNGECSCQDHF
ncbi:unnamed protein product [Adineta ricciae]|uniref:DYW domain-containing protein n=2 Tax=Adineta ricciae TaxID=249248 RepID=A0A814CH22_ADIRI|nr:unnamed protein product [Adineta ricciae]